MRSGTLLAGLALTTALTGCGGDDQTDAAEEMKAEFDSLEKPCAELEGAPFPEGYSGCTHDGERLAAITYECDDGRELHVSGPAYAFEGEPVTYDPEGGVDGPGFAKLFEECKG
jgi:hypothetical protein